MTIPFTYCITHIPTNRRYYGCRYAKGCDPSDLGNTYYTSSKHVKQMICDEGVENFTFEIRKIFNDIETCKKHEHTVLRRLNAAKSDNWLNRHNSGNGFYNTIITEETRKKLSESSKGRGKGRILSKETREKISKSNKGRKVSEETKFKISQATKAENNPMYGKIGNLNPNFGKKRGKIKVTSKAKNPCICNGEYFHSITDAEIYFKGICSVRKRLDNKRFPNWFRLIPKTKRK